MGDTDGEKRKRLTFNIIGLNAKDNFQGALDFFDNLDASKGKNNYLKNAICLKNYLKKKRLKTLTISLSGCILRSCSSPSPALIPTWH